VGQRQSAFFNLYNQLLLYVIMLNKGFDQKLDNVYNFDSMVYYLSDKQEGVSFLLRKSKISEMLKKACEKYTLKDIENGFEGFSATQLADQLAMDRANVSKELNTLFLEQRVIKVIGRPVYYFDAEVFEKLTHGKNEVFETDHLNLLIKEHKQHVSDPFELIIGSEGSLKTIIKKAKAAMIYPPFGLHTLLIGPTGVGKTMFAEIMYSFAKEQGVLNEKAEFVVFNCAEYADNPQLLLGQLFGYVKGAYTGADHDSEGLIHRANNGILFLDEIHRLSPEGQEMLFMLIDKGEYRRMGDSKNTKANVLILGATTENTDSALLKTFLRRIPMTITIPSLQERTIKERYDLIEKFLRQEYSQLKIPIQVTKKGMKALMGYDCPGNIGQLKADIRLLCARAFLDYKARDLARVEINSSLLADSTYAGIFKSEKQPEIMEIIDSHAGNLFIYNQEINFESFDFRDLEDIYGLIEKSFSRYEIEGYSADTISREIKKQIEEYISRLMNKLVNTDISQKEELYKIVSPRIYRSVEIAMQIAEHHINRSIPKKAYAAMALHMSAIVENHVTHSAFSANQYTMAMDHPLEYQTAKTVRTILQSELDIELPEQEIIFITLFLSMEEERKTESSHIGLLVLAHGNGVARNMADVANTLLCTHHAHALDMPLKQNVQEFLEVVSDKVKEIDEGKGVLLMVDMGSLLSFGELITEKTNIPVATVEMVSTPLVLEATRKTMMVEYTLDELAKEFKDMLPYIGRSFSLEMKNRIQQNYAIICTCLTGEGAAIKLGNLLRSAIPLIQEYDIEVLCCNKETFKEIDLKGKTILAIVGAVDLLLENVPYIPSDKMILENGLYEINQIIQRMVGSKSDIQEVPNYITHTVLAESLTFLDLDKTEDVIQKSFKLIEKMVDIQDYNRILVNYILHVGSMAERCIQGQILNYEKIDELIAAKPALYHAVKLGMMILEEEFKCSVPDTEIGYVMDLFDTE